MVKTPYMKSKWSSVNDRQKAYLIHRKAKDGYFKKDNEDRIIEHGRQKKLHELVGTELWKQLNSQGMYNESHPVGRPKIWMKLSDKTKAYNIVDKAKNGFYNEELCKRILDIENKGRRPDLVDLDIWSILTTSGTYYDDKEGE